MPEQRAPSTCLELLGRRADQAVLQRVAGVRRARRDPGHRPLGAQHSADAVPPQATHAGGATTKDRERRPPLPPLRAPAPRAPGPPGGAPGSASPASTRRRSSPGHPQQRLGGQEGEHTLHHLRQVTQHEGAPWVRGRAAIAAAARRLHPSRPAPRTGRRLRRLRRQLAPPASAQCAGAHATSGRRGRDFRRRDVTLPEARRSRWGRRAFASRFATSRQQRLGRVSQSSQPQCPLLPGAQIARGAVRYQHRPRVQALALRAAALTSTRDPAERPPASLSPRSICAPA